MDQQRQRQRLETLRAHLMRRERAVERDLRSGLAADFEEQSVELQNDEVLMRLASEGRPQLALIEHALDRMDTGTYGICAKCGDSIAVARLEALPHAVMCHPCAERQERAAQS